MLCQYHKSREMIAVTAAVAIAVPGTHGIAFVAAAVFFHEIPGKNAGVVVQKPGIGRRSTWQPGRGENDLVEQAPAVAVG